MDNIISLLTNLTASKLSNPDNDDLLAPISPFMLQNLLELCEYHNITAIIGSELLAQNLILQNHMYAKIQDTLCETVCYYEKMNYEFQWLCDLLEDAQIPFVPLKGAVVRDYYPEPWLRVSGDIDILIQECFLDKAVALLVQKGCRLERSKRFHDIPLITPGGILLELHFHIRENIPAMDLVLDRVWDFLEPVPGKQFQRRQSNTFLIFHLLAHMAYHLVHGGCGIGSFIDIWLLQKHLAYDRKQLNALCCEAELALFYDNVNHLIGVWFEGKEHNPTSRSLEQLVINGGVFGNADNRILIEQAQQGGKYKHLLRRIIKPHKELKSQFPVLEQKPWLMPVYQIKRWSSVFTGNRLSSVMQEYLTGQNHPKKQILATKKLLDDVGLKMN